MEIQQLGILLRLILAHLIADFILQSSNIAQGKKKGIKSTYFVWHICIVGATTYLLLAQWHLWWVPLLVMLLHGVIDLIKIQFKKDDAILYLSDQFLHLLSLVGVWILITDNSTSGIFKYLLSIPVSDHIFIILISYLIVTVPVGILIAYITRPWSKEIAVNSEESLRNAGRTIGIIERILVLTFVLLQQWSAIGFLLAAKSVFRFGDLKEGKDRKRTEYILIGTFLSFIFSLFIGIITLYWTDSLP
jgi:hypothetical protein